jgi:hypothetical protein
MQMAWSEEWETSGDPRRLLEMQIGRMTLRELRLFAAGFLRWDHEQHRRLRPNESEFLELVEYFLASEHNSDEKHWDTLRQKNPQKANFSHPVRLLTRGLEAGPSMSFPGITTGELETLYRGNALKAASRAAGPAPSDVHPGHEWHRTFQAAYFEAVRPVANLLRCIFPNVVNPARFDANWRTDTTRGIARRIFDTQDFTAMPILADAIQDAGCEDERILAHCRGGQTAEGLPAGGWPIGCGPHVRGCWVLEAILKS